MFNLEDSSTVIKVDIYTPENHMTKRETKLFNRLRKNKRTKAIALLQPPRYETWGAYTLCFVEAQLSNGRPKSVVGMTRKSAGDPFQPEIGQSLSFTRALEAV